MLFDPTADVPSPSNAGTTWPKSSIFGPVQLGESHREEGNGAAWNMAQFALPIQDWSDNYINDITTADSSSDAEESLARSTPRIVQSIEADDPCTLSQSALAQAARAALQAMSNNIIRIPQASKGKRKYEDHRDQEDEVACNRIQNAPSRAPLQAKSSNIANTGRARIKKRKHT
jgi:hypothetical protein